MTRRPGPLSSLDDTRGLVAQIQGFGFESARLVVSRFTEMFERFQAEAGSVLVGGDLGTLARTRGEDGEPGELRLPDVAPGGRCTARLWLHNPTESPSQGLRLWVSRLLAHDGKAIDSSAASFSPATVARIDADSSVEIVVTLNVPTETRSGRYHGQILVEGQPDTSLPISFNVLAPEER